MSLLDALSLDLHCFKSARWCYKKFIYWQFHSNYFIVLEKNHNYAYQNHNSCPRFLRFFAQSMSIGNSSSKLNFCQMHLVYLPKPGPKSKPDLVVEFFNVFLLKSTVLNLISLCLIKNQVLRIAFTKKCLPQPLASNFGKTQGFFFEIQGIANSKLHWLWKKSKKKPDETNRKL